MNNRFNTWMLKMNCFTSRAGHALAGLVAVIASLSVGAATYEMRNPIHGLKVVEAECLLPWGGSLASNVSMVGYTQGTVAYGGSCDSVKVSLSCKNGTLASNGATSASCQVLPPPYESKTLNFETWPTYDGFFTTVQGTVKVVNDTQLKVLGSWDSAGYSRYGQYFDVRFTVPPNAINPKVTFKCGVSYDQTLNLRDLATGVIRAWSGFSACNWFATPMIVNLTAGRSYSLDSTALSQLNGNYVLIDDIQVTYTLP